MGFNPYFSGCFSLRIINHCHTGSPAGFQSLFFWMLLSKVVARIIPSGSRVFQSLFFWMLLSKSIDPVVVLPGLALFQSLFFWMLLSKGVGESVHTCNTVVSILIFLDASL